MKRLVKATLIGSMAFLIGAAISATTTPAQESEDGWNADLSKSELAMSFAVCEDFGAPAEAISWCREASDAATTDPDIATLAESVEVVEVGGQLKATIPDDDAVLITSIPGSE